MADTNETELIGAAAIKPKAEQLLPPVSEQPEKKKDEDAEQKSDKLSELLFNGYNTIKKPTPEMLKKVKQELVEHFADASYPYRQRAYRTIDYFSRMIEDCQQEYIKLSLMQSYIEATFHELNKQPWTLTTARKILSDDHYESLVKMVVQLNSAVIKKKPMQTKMFSFLKQFADENEMHLNTATENTMIFSVFVKMFVSLRFLDDYLSLARKKARIKSLEHGLLEVINTFISHDTKDPQYEVNVDTRDDDLFEKFEEFIETRSTFPVCETMDDFEKANRKNVVWDVDFDEAPFFFEDAQKKKSKFDRLNEKQQKLNEKIAKENENAALDLIFGVFPFLKKKESSIEIGADDDDTTGLFNRLSYLIYKAKDTVYPDLIQSDDDASVTFVMIIGCMILWHFFRKEKMLGTLTFGLLLMGLFLYGSLQETTSLFVKGLLNIGQVGVFFRNLLEEKTYSGNILILVRSSNNLLPFYTAEQWIESFIDLTGYGIKVYIFASRLMPSLNAYMNYLMPTRTITEVWWQPFYELTGFTALAVSSEFFFKWSGLLSENNLAVRLGMNAVSMLIVYIWLERSHLKKTFQQIDVMKMFSRYSSIGTDIEYYTSIGLRDDVTNAIQTRAFYNSVAAFVMIGIAFLERGELIESTFATINQYELIVATLSMSFFFQKAKVVYDYENSKKHFFAVSLAKAAMVFGTVPLLHYSAYVNIAKDKKNIMNMLNLLSVFAQMASTFFLKKKYSDDNIVLSYVAGKLKLSIPQLLEDTRNQKFDTDYYAPVQRHGQRLMAALCVAIMKWRRKTDEGFPDEKRKKFFETFYKICEKYKFTFKKSNEKVFDMKIMDVEISQEDENEVPKAYFEFFNEFSLDIKTYLSEKELSNIFNTQTFENDAMFFTYASTIPGDKLYIRTLLKQHVARGMFFFCYFLFRTNGKWPDNYIGKFSMNVFKDIKLEKIEQRAIQNAQQNFSMQSYANIGLSDVNKKSCFYAESDATTAGRNEYSILLNYITTFECVFDLFLKNLLEQNIFSFLTLLNSIEVDPSGDVNSKNTVNFKTRTEFPRNTYAINLETYPIAKTKK